MATLSFRLPAHRPSDLAARHGARSRCAAPIKAPLLSARRGGLTLVTEVLGLLPPTGPSMIELPAMVIAEVGVEERASTGWFDSTWDLQQGLEISEGLPVDLPLGDWLQMYLVD